MEKPKCIIILFLFFSANLYAQSADSLLCGEYITIQYSVDGEGTPHSVYSNTVIDGNGNGSYNDLYSSDDILQSGDFTYSINNDRTFTVNIDAETLLYGIAHPDGQSYMMVKTDPSPIIVMGIKKSSGYSEALLNGEFINVEYSVGEGGPYTAYSATDIDGSGNGTWEHLYTSDDVLSSGTFTYTIGDDGTLIVNTSDQVVLRGIVHPDGQSYIMMITQPIQVISIGIKKSSGLSETLFNGKYINIQYTADTGGGSYAFYGEVDVDGIENGTYQGLHSTNDINQDGSFTYAVEDNGELVVNADSEIMLRGMVHSDGQSYIMVRTEEDPIISMGISQGDTSTTAIDSRNGLLPKFYMLSQNYPNPFNPTTSIRYSIKRTVFVTLKVYDLLGKEILTLVDEFQNPNTYLVNVDATELSTGIYFYRFYSNHVLVDSKKMVLVR
ncbi:T9SS type A sorting domain-containing protein [bacterium]|nr:T9SS type A sorting domain-containing protein [bacterium]RQV95977.1 MAG: T9SS C-terminal target domain-containing protein [bacterium]